MNNNIIADLRISYTAASLDASDVAASPIAQFEAWFVDALAAKLLEPNAMLLATVSAEGRPSARTVLLKGVSENGFIFYTNYKSRKGQQLAERPFAALVFSWLPLERQVRIEGEVVKISREASERYFQSRPKGSQIGAMASPQSEPIADRIALETLFKDVEEAYLSENVLPLPDDWGGYQVKPTRIEFWQGRPSRLHDRICYTLQVDGTWKIERLAP